MTTLIKVDSLPSSQRLRKLKRPSTPITSDQFYTDRADLNGTSTDCLMGGTPRTWTSNPTAYLTSGGFLRQGNNAASTIVGAGLNVGVNNIRGTIGLMGLPAGTINFDFRKSQIDNAAIYSPCYRLRVNNAGFVELLRKPTTAAQYTVVSTGAHVITMPGTIGLELYNREISIQ